MRRILTLVLSAFLLAVPPLAAGAAAAERVLIAPTGMKQTLSATPSAAAGLRQLRQKAASQGKLRVIVGLRVPFAAEGLLAGPAKTAQRRDIANAETALRKRFAATVGRDPGAVQGYASLPFMAMEVSQAELDRLASDPLVLTLVEDKPRKPRLAQSTALVNAPQAWQQGYSGAGQAIAIIDTGVDGKHPFLAGKVVSEACYTKGGCPRRTSVSTAAGSAVPCAVKAECWHGTHVAGIAAGKGPNFSGVAKDANIIAIQVFSRYGRGITAWDSDILAGMNRVFELRNSFRIAAVNLSLGGDDLFYDHCDVSDPAYVAAIATLRSAGIATVVSSGNDGSYTGIASPACITGAVSVGAVWDTEGWTCDGTPSAVDKVACYSNAANILSLLAPGSAITSSVPGRGYRESHGTSFAAPHVAGAWAVLRQMAPQSDGDQILKALQDGGKPVTDYRFGLITKPRIDLAGAISRFTTLTITRSGTGLGTMSINTATGVYGDRASGPADCSSGCVVTVPLGLNLTITSSAAPESEFTGWAGACSGPSPCQITVTPNLVLNAAFAGVSHPIDVHVAGGGSVGITTTTGGRTCTGDCSISAAPGTTASLAATAANGFVFSGWSGGACAGSGSCALVMAGAKSVTATFTPAYPLSFTKTGTGTGRVVFSPAGTAGAECSQSCTQNFTPGTVVTLTAVAASGARFRSWSGACRGKRSCVVTMSEARSVVANFSGR